MPCFTYPFIGRWTFGLFPPVGIVNHDAMNMCVCVCVCVCVCAWTYVFISPGCIQRMHVPSQISNSASEGPADSSTAAAPFYCQSKQFSFFFLFFTLIP